MRIRRKPWVRPELEACPFCIKKPSGNKNKWNGMFGNSNPLHIELGCGKGGFISKLAPLHPEINYIAVDIKSEMLGLAKRKIEKEYAEAGLEIKNVLIFAQNIEMIDEVFGENDVIDRIYINFCNPWPRKKHKKHRLTHPRQLQKYRTFLKDGGEIRLKTDDDGLFEDSIAYFEECGFEIKYIAKDLHSSGFEENIPTEHENMFSEMGIPIKFLIAVKK